MALTPFLMFVGQAEEAMDYYVSTFPDAEVLAIDRMPSDPDGGPAVLRSATFRIADLTLRCIDSPGVHDFGFTPSVSFFYDCDDVPSFDAIVDRLADGGSVLMPPAAYPFAHRFAWVNDRFGVSWQLSVALEAD